MSPYDWIFAHPDELLFYAGITLILLAWAFLSIRYTIRWYVSFREGMTRWSGLPDKKASNELVLLTLTWAANLLIIGAFVHAVV